jgi:UDP-N-acetylmuramate: L-alanyl-gamma-D-glutamyl-meso-diaminopimelate ligase
VVEADEYDTAFFDKRSKFVHYHPRTLILNNLEYDHADIFPDLEAIRIQFHHLVRTVPGNGLIIRNAADENLSRVLERGCWSGLESFSEAGSGGQWQARLLAGDGSHFEVLHDARVAGTVQWSLIGQHNVSNALAAIIAARHAGVSVGEAVSALGSFEGVKRRMEVRGSVSGITVYDDFAHHPTAIATTLQGLRNRVGDDRILVLLEPRSNTMQLGVHRDVLAASLRGADRVWLYQPPRLGWSLQEVAAEMEMPAAVADSIDALLQSVLDEARRGDHILIMSNGGFGGIHERLLAALQH